jgi:hypothetical protein
MENINLNKTALVKELAVLQKENKAVAIAVKASSEKERLHMSIAYLWWRKAKNVKGLLKELYKKNGIETRSVKNKINFRPLLKLLSKGEISDTDLDLWNVCMNKMHVEFEGAQDHYGTDSAERLSTFIEDNGGKTGLAGYHLKDKAEYEEESNDSYNDSKLVKQWDTELDEQEYFSTYVDEAKRHYSDKPMLKATLPPIPLTNEGYGVVIIKKDGTKSNLMNVLSDDRVVNSLIVDTYRKDMSAMPIAYRSILEPLQLLNVPKVVAENIDLFIENSKVDSYWLDDKKVTAHKRMTYRKDTGDFLISNVCAESSVVLIAKPLQKNLFANPVADLCLSNVQRRSIEVRLLHKQMFNMYSTDCEKQFKTMNSNVFPYQLPLQNKMHIEDVDGIDGAEVAKAISNYGYKNICWMPFSTHVPTCYAQVDVAENGLNGAWNCDVDVDWVREATDKFFDGWIAAYAKKHKRKINKTLEVSFDKKGMTIGYEVEDDEYDNEMPLHMDGASGKTKFVVRSIDFAFVMRQLADLDVRGAVCMAANGNGIELTFATATHKYMCVIPACDEKGERQTELFTQYMPTQTEEEYEFEYELDMQQAGFTEDDVLTAAEEVLA